MSLVTTPKGRYDEPPTLGHSRTPFGLFTCVTRSPNRRGRDHCPVEECRTPEGPPEPPNPACLPVWPCTNTLRCAVLHCTAFRGEVVLLRPGPAYIALCVHMCVMFCVWRGVSGLRRDRLVFERVASAYITRNGDFGPAWGMPDVRGYTVYRRPCCRAYREVCRRGGHWSSGLSGSVLGWLLIHGISAFYENIRRLSLNSSGGRGVVGILEDVDSCRERSTYFWCCCRYGMSRHW